MPLSKQVTIQTICRSGYSRLENIYKDPKISVPDSEQRYTSAEINQKYKWMDP
jgi:hypothetical protein